MLTDQELLRYSRQVLLDGWDIDAQLRLKNSRVLMVGTGGLGCPVAQTLVRAGVGYLKLIDFDVIDESNLQRQNLFFDQDIGKPKAVVASLALKKHNPLVQVDYCTDKVSNDNTLSLLAGGFDLVIDGTDNFAVRDILNRACRQLALPLLSNSAIAQMGQIALFTKDTACYQCVFGTDDGDEQTCATSGVLASTVAVIGSLTAQIALEFLGKQHNPIANQLLLWQGQTLTLKKLTLTPNPSCPICQTS